MSEPAQEADIRRYVGFFRRHARLIAACTVGLMLVALAASLLQKERYRAEAHVLLRPRSTVSLSSDDGENRLVGTVETETQVVKSDPVRRAVRRAIGAAPRISAGRIGETEVMEIAATDTSARNASRVANAYAREYVRYRRTQALDDLVTASEELQVRIDSLQRQIDEVGRAMPTGGEQARARYVQLVTQQGVLSQKLNELQVDAALRDGGAEIVKAADVPTSPSSPKPVQNAVLGLLLGALVGLAAATVRDRLDESLKTKDDLDDLLPGVPVLGAIPTIEEVAGGAPLAESLREGASPAAEAYRTLRTSVQLLGVDQPLATIQVTSPMASEGKTSTLARLGVVFAQTGQRVVLLDCDLRRPRVHEVFGIPNNVGFTSVFLGEKSLDDATVAVPGADGLFVVPSGPIPANPSEVLASRRTSEVIFALRQRFDVVLIDSAPVLPVTDATVLAAWVDGTIVVVHAGQTTKKQVTEAVGRLRQVNASIAGTVLNRAEPEVGYGYDDYYTSPDEGPRDAVSLPAHPSAPLRTDNGGSTVRSDAP